MVNKHSILLFLLTVVMFFGTALYAKDIYVWQDENGVTVYSDVKRPGAKKITLSENKVTIMKKANTSVFADSTSSKKTVNYAVEIISPRQEETIRDNNGELHFNWLNQVNPNYNVQLLLDGKIVKSAQKSATFIKWIDRGGTL